MIKSWTISFEYNQGYLPKLRFFRTPRPGDRVMDGGMMGTLIACCECSGDGLLHKPDDIPRGIPAYELDYPPDTLALDLAADSLNYQIGDVVWTRNAHYVVETIVHDRDTAPGTRTMHLLRADLEKKHVVQKDKNITHVRESTVMPHSQTRKNYKPHSEENS